MGGVGTGIVCHRVFRIEHLQQGLGVRLSTEVLGHEPEGCSSRSIDLKESP